MTTKPWPKEKLDLHVTQRIREQIDISTMIVFDQEDDGYRLRENGEHTLWEIIQEAISDGGWEIRTR